MASRRRSGAFVYTVEARGSRGRPLVTQGGRNSVHRWPKMVPRSRFGAFVYTVAARGSRGRPVVTQGDSIVYTDRRKRPFDAILGHLCTLLRCGQCRELRHKQRRRQRRGLRRMTRAPQRHGVPTAPPWWPPHPWSRKQVLYVPLPRAFLYSSMNEPNMPLVFPSCLPNALEPLATALETWASTFLATFDPCALALA